jgi:glucose/arabinose dehydrogenase
MRFYTGSRLPAEYRNQIFFAEGWLQPGDRVQGRPAGVLVLPDGSLLVSDDHAGALYRITYGRR